MAGKVAGDSSSSKRANRLAGSRSGNARQSAVRRSSASEPNASAELNRLSAALRNPVRRANSSNDPNGPSRRAATITSAYFSDNPQINRMPSRKVGEEAEAQRGKSVV